MTDPTALAEALLPCAHPKDCQGLYDDKECRVLAWCEARACHRNLVGTIAAAITADRKAHAETVAQDVRRKAFEEADATLLAAYTVLAFAFERLHSSARSRDSELASNIGKVRARIKQTRAALRTGEEGS